MNFLEVTSEQIIFKYKQKGHLQSSLVFKNPSHSHACFKFKVTRPKYYLIKPDQGLTPPLSETTVSVTLHQDGVNQSEGDKFKIYYKFVQNPGEEPTKGWEKQPDVMSIRFTVVVDDLPEQYKQNFDRVKVSDVKSLANSKFDGNRPSSQINIQQRQNRLSSLKLNVQELKHNGGRMVRSGSNMKEYLIAGAIGLVIGLLSSFWA